MCKNLSYKILFILSLILTNTLGKAQFISVDTNYNAQQLVDKFLGANNACIRVSNVSITGWNTPGELSYGYFTKNGSNFSIDEGIILSTGKAADAHGPKGDIQSFTKDSWHGDSLLEQALNMQNTFNATILEFDFTPSLSDRISFEYMFLSEQYLTNPVNTPKLNQCNYTDAFVFLIKEKNDPATSYKNIAVLPNTNIPVAVNTVRGQTDNNACPVANPQYFGQYNSRNPTISPTNFNGETKVLTASTIVDAGKIYTIRLAIADQNNGLYDSAVFLKAGSFVGNQNLGSDLTMDYKTALCPGEIHKIDATPISGNPISFIWKKNGQILPIGSVTSGGTTITNLTSQINIKAPNQFDEYTPENEDLYEVEIELDSGCRLKGDVKVEKQISPDIHQSLKFEAPCDDDLDGNIDVFFSAYVQRIISNISASDQSFDIKYFKDKPADPNNPDFSQAITSISFSTDSQSVWIWVKPGNCDPFLKEITFSKKAKSIPNTYSDIPICDNELTGSKEVDLMDYKDIIASNIVGTPRFYKSRPDANNQSNVLANTKITLTPTSQNKYYIRYNQLDLCDDVEEMTFIFKQPAKSTTLEDLTICKNATTTLDAGVGPGTGFTSYEWSYIDPITQTNATTQTIENVPVGIYTVKLGYNNCFYTQTVKVKAATSAIIDAIDINGSTVTVSATGGTQPYFYALDGDPNDSGHYQASNIFHNVPIGQHVIYLKSKDGCDVVSRNFSIVNISNVISPNGDGINDNINLSELLNKTDAHFKIYNRNGVLVFEGNSGNNFIWNGKQNGHVLPTGSYWYTADWTEPTSGKRQQIKGWILLKNY